MQGFFGIFSIMSIYLDCNATTPIEPRVQDVVMQYLREDFGNAGSRTHEYGAKAKKAVETARSHVAKLLNAKKEEVVFTSGATESNNIAILGLAKFGKESGKKHIISTEIEHKAVLEPLKHLTGDGFEITLVSPSKEGCVNPEDIRKEIRPDTFLISVMNVNNETGVIQPIDEIAEVLKGYEAYFHCDAAQGFGKDIDQLQNSRIDLISISGHKIYAPKGVGALACRRRRFKMPPITPLVYGGGQERGLRPGTVPVHLAVGLGKAAELAKNEAGKWSIKCAEFKEKMLQELSPLKPSINGDQARTLPNVVNLSFAGIDSEAVMLALKGIVAISNGSACTSSSYEPSHVLAAMGLSEAESETALRWSWCHMTDKPNWGEIRQALLQLM